MRPIKIANLRDAGFKEVGRWQLDSRSRLYFRGQLPPEPGVYLFVVDRSVSYVGSAQRGLSRRFRKYTNPQNNGAVAVRVRSQIVTALKNDGAVRVFAMVCKKSSWKGLPIDLVAGLEEGLICSLRPAWNIRGIAKARKSADLS